MNEDMKKFLRFTPAWEIIASVGTGAAVAARLLLRVTENSLEFKFLSVMIQSRLTRCLPTFLAAAACLLPAAVQATPAFARQLNMQCVACHTEFPIMNDFGRAFKLGGYTLSAEQTQLPPLSVMVQPGFTHTQESIPGGAAPGYHGNNNVALGQVSVFYTGRLFGPYAKSLFGPTAGAFLNKIGVFYQHTYDGIAHHWAWDNVEFRFADTTTLFGQAANLGFYVNNNPTMQDPWNTLAAWGYPFNTSPLAPTPAAATLIDGGLSQQVVGFGTYAYINTTWYFDIGVYHTLGSGFQKFMGVDPTDETIIHGIAPYWRVAYSKKDETGSHTWEIGTSGLFADTYPTGVATAGKDQILDLGIDAQYQTVLGNNDLVAMLSWTHENQWWNASRPLEFASNASDTLWKAAATIHILHDKTYSAAVQYFITDGSKDANRYAASANGSPLSDGVLLELNWMPFNKKGGPDFWPRSTVKFTAHYIIYNRFNGGRSNWDGMGAKASANNTLFLGAWLVF